MLVSDSSVVWHSACFFVGIRGRLFWKTVHLMDEADLAPWHFGFIHLWRHLLKEAAVGILLEVDAMVDSAQVVAELAGEVRVASTDGLGTEPEATSIIFFAKYCLNSVNFSSNLTSLIMLHLPAGSTPRQWVGPYTTHSRSVCSFFSIQYTSLSSLTESVVCGANYIAQRLRWAWRQGMHSVFYLPYTFLATKIGSFTFHAQTHTKAAHNK